MSIALLSTLLSVPTRWPIDRSDWLVFGCWTAAVLTHTVGPDSQVWAYALLLTAGVSLIAWMRHVKRYRETRDLPVSKIASAAQGYVRLSGYTKLAEPAPLRAPLSNLRCCWYRYSISEKDGDEWKTLEEGESTSPFPLVDASGTCLVAPEGAEVWHTLDRSWMVGDLCHAESLLLPRRPLYAVGDFRSSRGLHPAADKRREVSELLAAWKADKGALLQRFDTDRDGEVDLSEYGSAHQAASEEIEARHRRAQSAAPEHRLCKPTDGRAFVLAVAPVERLGRHFAVWSVVYLGGFSMALVLAWVQFMGGGRG